MALTCSVLGHAYGDPTVERDREERGSEVVVTIREYETCSRCGTTRIVSENKEVTAVEADADGEPASDHASDDGDATPDHVGDAPVEPGDHPTEPAGEDPIGAAGEDPAEPAAEDPAVEDAEIMDAEETGPAVDDELASPSVAEPAEPAEPTADESPPPAEEDAVVIEDDGADEERAPGEWPDAGEEPDEPDWTPASEPEESGADIDRAPGRTVTVPEGEFHCEECDYSTPVESSSLRAGDFCPSCHRGTLQHVREEQG
jgi:hypothetical protein